MAWRLITKLEAFDYHRKLSSGRIRLTNLFAETPDGRATTVQVWSRDGINLLRRDTIWISTDGDGKAATYLYFASDKLKAMHFRGVRHDACKDCAGLCCRDRLTVVPLYPDEVVDIRSGKLSWPMEQCGLEYNLKRGDDGVCVYLDGSSNRCKIYKRRRPQACRFWFCGKGTRRDEQWRAIRKNVEIELGRAS